MACDGNEIDTMFVDRRRDEGQHGQTLVRTCTMLYEPSELHYPWFHVRSVVFAVCPAVGDLL